MNVTLRPEHERAIAQLIESGAYENPDAMIEEALELFLSEEAWLREQRSEISEKIGRAMAQLERGEGLGPEELRADMDRRKAAWLANGKT